MTLALEERFFQTNGIRLHTVLSGPENGRLVLLLHGFPDFWYGWRHHIVPLAVAGYRVMAPDLRGYNTSDKPPEVSAYRLDAGAADVLGLLDAVGRDRAVVVGHDWGAAIGWWLATHHASRLEKLVVLNVAHPTVMQRHFRRSLRQLARSWYALFFQLPWLPEALMRIGRFRPMYASVRRTARPGAFTGADGEHYREAWGQPGALTGMVNWYRAMLRPPPRIASPRVSVPTLMIWGARDRFLRPELAPLSMELCDRGRLVIMNEATHWVQLEEPGRVSDLILEFLAEED